MITILLRKIKPIVDIKYREKWRKKERKQVMNMNQKRNKSVLCFVRNYKCLCIFYRELLGSHFYLFLFFFFLFLLFLGSHYCYTFFFISFHFFLLKKNRTQFYTDKFECFYTDRKWRWPIDQMPSAFSNFCNASFSKCTKVTDENTHRPASVITIK